MTPNIAGTADPSPRPSPSRGEGERRRRRRWLRFSLRTLVLLVLLIGSGATLWWNWGPWAVAYTIYAEADVDYAYFVNDDRQILIVYKLDAARSSSGKGETVLDIREADTGRRRSTIREDWPAPASDWLVATAGADYALLFAVWGERPVMYRIHSGERVDFKALFPNDGEVQHLVLRRNHVLIDFAARSVLAKLPGFDVVYFAGGPRHTTLSLSDNEKLFAIGTAKGTEIRSVETKEVVSTIQAEIGRTRFSDELLGAYDSLDKGSTTFFDPRSGEQLRACEGKVSRVSFDGSYFVLNSHQLWYLGAVRSKDALIPLPPASDDFDFSPTDNVLLDRSQCRMLDARTAEVLWEARGCSGYFLYNGEHVVAESRDVKRTRILNARTGQCEFEFSPWRWQGLPKTVRVSKALRSENLLTFGYPESAEKLVPAKDANKHKADDRAVSVWRLRRPVASYGMAWLPEFWMTVVLAAALVWSIWRDRRIGKRA